MALKMFSPAPRSPLSKIAHVIAIAAGKGGVGKSLVAVNMALTLRNAGYAVGILDADLYGPSIRRMLPEDEHPRKSQDKLYPAIAKGIKVLTMAYFCPPELATAVRAPIANNILGQFLKDCEWGPLDFLLIDFPPGTGDIQLTLSQRGYLSSALLVTTPQEIALLDVRKAANLFSKVNVPLLGIVENMSHLALPNGDVLFPFGSGGGMRLAQELGSPLLGSIPLDPSMGRCADEGKPFNACDSEGKDTASIAAFEQLTKNVVAHAHALKAAQAGNLTSFELQWKEM